MTVEIEDLSVGDLEDALWRAAQDDLAHEAAVLLLTVHGTWLRRPAFRQHVSLLQDEPEADPRGPVWAQVDWSALLDGLGRPYDPDREDGQLCQSSSTERGMLAIAASVGGGGRVDLREALSGLDDRNLALVRAAVTHSQRGFAGAAELWPRQP